MKRISYLCLIALFILPFIPIRALAYSVNQPHSKSHIFFGADLMSRYIWRGMQFGGNSPSIQPYFTYKTGSFETGVWGAFSLSGKNYSQEVDLHVSQSFAKNMFTVTLTDYFFPEEFGNYDYFDYKNQTTGHILEGSFAFNGTKKFPLTVMVATNFYGDDAARIEDDPNSLDFNKKTGIQYSTYFELSYPFKINLVNINTFIGVNATTPRKADVNTGYKGETGFYGNRFGVVNLGFTASRAIQITNKYALPIMVSLITNPQAKKIYFVFGISF